MSIPLCQSSEIIHNGVSFGGSDLEGEPLTQIPRLGVYLLFFDGSFSAQSSVS